jgi:hypothetical protein
MVSMIIGTAASATGTGTCAFAAVAAKTKKPVARTQRSRADCDAGFMRLRGSFHFFGGDAQRFQKANILRGHGEFAAGLSLQVGFVERVLIDLNAKRFEETTVKRGEFRILIAGSVAARQSNGGVEFQHDIVTVRAHSSDGAGDAVRFGNRIVDGVTQFTEKVFKVIV